MVTRAAGAQAGCGEDDAMLQTGDSLAPTHAADIRKAQAARLLR